MLLLLSQLLRNGMRWVREGGGESFESSNCGVGGGSGVNRHLLPKMFYVARDSCVSSPPPSNTRWCGSGKTFCCLRKVLATQENNMMINLHPERLSAWQTFRLDFWKKNLTSSGNPVLMHASRMPIDWLTASVVLRAFKRIDYSGPLFNFAIFAQVEEDYRRRRRRCWGIS